VQITILPSNIRAFLEKDRGAVAPGSDLTSEIRAAEILVKNDISEEELRRGEHQANDYFLKPEEVDPVEWAKSLAAEKVQGEAVALGNRKTFLSVAKRLSVIRVEDIELVVEFMTDPDQANKASAIMEIQRGDHVPVVPYLPNTDFKDRNDLWATATSFSNTLDFELRALAQAVLNASEAGILLVDSRFTGIFGTTRSEGHLSAELEKLNKDPDIKSLAKRIAYEEAHPPRINLSTNLDDDSDDPSAVHKAIREAFPMSAAAADQLEANKEHEAAIDSLKKKLNDAVNAKSSLSVAGLKGFDAYDFLPKKTERVRSQLAGALADGSRRIDTAREELRDDSKFVYGADKVITLEKAQLNVTAGTSLDRIIDGVVEARLEEKTTWESISELINILAALPIPPPAGPILRAVAAGINIGEQLNKNAAANLAADVSLKKDRPSNAGLALDIVITAAGTIADVASIDSHAAAAAGHELNSQESEIANEIGSGRNAENEGSNVAGKQKEIDSAEQSLHLPSEAKVNEAVELTTEAQAEEFVKEHPPKEVYGEPGERFAPIDNGKHSMVEEIDEEGLITCKLYSGKGIPVKCKAPLGGQAQLDRVPLADYENQAQRRADLQRLRTSPVPLPGKLSREQALMQKDYQAYYSKRILDLERGAEREAPLTFESYVKFQKSLRRARQGTGFQAEEAQELIGRLGKEKVETNAGLSKVEKPKIIAGKSQTKYVDALVNDKEHGYVGISNKAREFDNPATISKDVTADVNELVEKYGGDRYVRRPSMEKFRKPVKVNNLILAYEADRIITVAGQGATPLGMQQYIREVVEEAAQAYPDLNIAVVFR